MLDFNIIYNRNLNGENITSIARDLGIHRDKIVRLFRKNGVSYKRNPIPFNQVNIDIEELKKLYIEGYSVLKMAKHFGVSRIVVNARLKQIGYKIRTGSEANIIRFKNSTLEERMAITKKAHEAVRGKKRTIDKRMRASKSRENTAQKMMESYSHLGVGEIEIFKSLRDNNFAPILQKAIYIYNIDIFIEPNICIEVSCGRGIASKTQCVTKRGAKEFIEKAKYLTNNGFVLIEINFRDLACLSLHNDKLIAFFQRITSNPPARCKHLMISCRYEPMPRYKEFGKFATSPKPKQPLWEIKRVNTLSFG